MSGPRRTWWHLESLGRKPGEYDIATSRLLYHPQRGFEVTTPAAAWQARHQGESALQCADWEAFADPRATNYMDYTLRRHEAEIFADGLLRAIEESDYDRRLAPDWRATLEGVIPTLRFPCHGLQMVVSYIGQLAPAGRIAITALLQTADEIRRIERLAYRMRQLQELDPGFGADSRQRWERAPEWQPLRALIEKLLATYDWGEAFVALNCVVKPAFDELFMLGFAARARQAGDDKLEALLQALMRDCHWQREWSQALLRLAPDSRPAVEAWFEAWLEPTLAALDALRPVLGSGDDWPGRLESTCRTLQAGCRTDQAPAPP